VQPSAELTSQVLPKAAKISNTKGHVAVVKNIRTVAVNNAINPCKIKFCKGFYNCDFYVIYSQKMALDKF